MKIENQVVNGVNTNQQNIAPKSLGQEDFLKILVAQMRHQDPLSPASDTEFIGQMAQFSTLEQIVNLNQNFQLLTYMMGAGFDSANAFSMIGKSVEIESGSELITGIVDKVTRRDGEFMVQVNSKLYPLGKINSVSNLNTPIEDNETVDEGSAGDENE